VLKEFEVYNILNSTGGSAMSEADSRVFHRQDYGRPQAVTDKNQSQLSSKRVPSKTAVHIRMARGTKG
jgi:hypothetical protein